MHSNVTISYPGSISLSRAGLCIRYGTLASRIGVPLGGNRLTPNLTGRARHHTTNELSSDGSHSIAIIAVFGASLSYSL